MLIHLANLEFSVSVKGSLTLLFGCDKIKKSLLQVTLKSPRGRREVTVSLADAEEISADAAVDGTRRLFHIKRRANNKTDGVSSVEKMFFCFTSSRFW